MPASNTCPARARPSARRASCSPTAAKGPTRPSRPHAWAATWPSSRVWATTPAPQPSGSRFAADGINTEALFTAKDTPTGTALIFVSQDGENCIAVAPGANHSLTCEAIDAVADRIAGAEYLLVQLEIPMETVACAIEKAYAAGTRVVLNPAPAMPLADELLRKVYLITPNRTESETLTGIPVHTVQDASKAAGALLAKGVGNVIVTLGSEGALIRTPAEELLIPARTVTPVDTTAAGDVFNGALLVALSEGRSLADAVRFAAHSASVSVTRMGAQASIPWRGELETLA